MFAELSRDIKLQDQVYEKAREWDARWPCLRAANSCSSRSLTLAAEQELDKQSVDTNALLKLATTHVRRKPRVHARYRRVA